jgi:hypothetical protein
VAPASARAPARRSARIAASRVCLLHPPRRRAAAAGAPRSVPDDRAPCDTAEHSCLPLAAHHRRAPCASAGRGRRQAARRHRTAPPPTSPRAASKAAVRSSAVSGARARARLRLSRRSNAAATAASFLYLSIYLSIDLRPPSARVLLAASAARLTQRPDARRAIATRHVREGCERRLARAAATRAAAHADAPAARRPAAFDRRGAAARAHGQRRRPHSHDGGVQVIFLAGQVRVANRQARPGKKHGGVSREAPDAPNVELLQEGHRAGVLRPTARDRGPTGAERGAAVRAAAAELRRPVRSGAADSDAAAAHRAARLRQRLARGALPPSHQAHAQAQPQP